MIVLDDAESRTMIVLTVPFGAAWVRVGITDTCEEAALLREEIVGCPKLIVCRCKLGRLLLAAAEPAERELVDKFIFALNPAGELNQ